MSLAKTSDTDSLLGRYGGIVRSYGQYSTGTVLDLVHGSTSEEQYGTVPYGTVALLEIKTLMANEFYHISYNLHNDTVLK